MRGLSLIFIAPLVFGSSGYSSGHKIQVPESELSSIETDLINIDRQLSASRAITESRGIGPQKKLAEISFKRAEGFFNAGQLNATVRELNNYLNSVQVPEIKPYLASQLMLGDSYRNLGHKSKAVRAYRRYISSVLTMSDPKYEEFISVLEKTVPLIEVQSREGAKEMASILSTINTIRVPEFFRSDVYYLSARAASKIGKSKLAIEWFKKAEKVSRNDDTRARSLYFKAMIHLAQKDFKLAQSDLKEISAMSNEDSAGYRDIATLALARTNVHLKRPKRAVQVYEKIGRSSSSYREARFELIYVYLDQEEFSRARERAEEYLQAFPEHSGSYQIKTLLAYLQLRTSDYDQASSNIKSAQFQLDHLSEEINGRLKDKQKISYADTKYIIKSTSGKVGNPWMISEADRLFARLEELYILFRYLHLLISMLVEARWLKRLIPAVLAPL